MTSQPGQEPRPAARRALSIAAAAALALAAGFPAAMLWIHDIDDDPAYALPAGEPAAGGSRAVAMIAALVARETDEKLSLIHI